MTEAHREIIIFRNEIRFLCWMKGHVKYYQII